MNIKSTPRDVFLHLLSIGTLYFSAFWFIQLLVGLIDVAFPDLLNPYFDAGSGIRWAIASLVIIFPVHIWIMRFLNRDIKAAPEKAELKIRKWLLYLTLFLAAILIIGDLVAFIFNFLDGELTVRFFLKVLSVLAVAAAVFGYYLYDLRKKTGEFSSGAKMFVWITSGVVAAAIITAFFVAGSPFKQRQVRFDEQRVNHLQTIQSEIVNYWQGKEKLPASLDDLRDSIKGFVPPVDPETDMPYVYRVKDTLSFELCATFNLSSQEAQIGQTKAVPPMYNGGFANENWNHVKGEQCFERTIDPELYPTFPKNSKP